MQFVFQYLDEFTLNLCELSRLINLHHNKVTNYNQYFNKLKHLPF